MEKVRRIFLRLEESATINAGQELQRDIARKINDYFKERAFVLESNLVYNPSERDVDGSAFYIIPSSPPIHIKFLTLDNFPYRKLDLYLQAVPGNDLTELCSDMEKYHFKEVQHGLWTT